MTAIVIRPDDPEANPPLFRAAYEDRQAIRRTMGEALDALATKGNLPDTVAVLIRRFGSDEFFTQTQHDRMQFLVSRRSALTQEEQQELETLIGAELEATVARTDNLLSSLPE